MSLRIHPDEIVSSSSDPLLGKHDSWERVRLGDVAEVKNGFAFKSLHFNHDGVGVPLVRIRDVGADASKTFYSGDFDKDYWIESGDLLIGMDGDFRIASWHGPRALLNQRVCRLRVLDETDYSTNFLSHVTQGYLDAIQERTSSVTVKHLSSRTVADIPVPLPPLLEQRRIVEAIEEQFSRLDAGVESLQRVKRNLARMRASVLQAAVEGRLVPQDPEDEPAEVLEPPRDGLPVIPSAWRWTLLGSVALLVRNGVFVSRPDLDVSGVPIFRISAVRPGRLDETDIRYAHNVDEATIAKYSVQDGDLLFTRYSGQPEYVGACALVRGVPRPTLHPDKLIRVVVDSERLLPAFAEIGVSAGAGRRLIESRRRTTAGQTGISGRDLKQVPIPIPPLAEQHRIVAEVERQFSILDATEQAIEGGLKRAGGLRQAILREAFAGRLVPQDRSDEPAAALLERIRAERAKA